MVAWDVRQMASLWLPGVAALMVAGTSCGGGSSTSPETSVAPERSFERAGPLVVWSDRVTWGGGADAEIRGALVVDGSCVYLASDGGQVLPVWPVGTEWSEDTTSVELPTGEIVRPGDSVVGGGAYAQLPDLGSEIAAAALLLVEGCTDAARALATFNPNEAVTKGGP